MNPAPCFRSASLSSLSLSLCAALLVFACSKSLFAGAEPASANDEVVYDLNQVDQKPEPRGIRATPVYPPELKEAGISGQVIIRFVAGADGRVGNVEWYATTNPGFINAGVTAVKKWQFRSAKKSGKNVAVRMLIPMALNVDREIPAQSTKTMKPGVNDFSDFPKTNALIYSAAAVDKKPKAQNGNAAPVAPDILNGAKCAARIFYVMDARGKVIHARAVSADNDVWRKTCEAAVLKWKFSPAIKDGKPVYCGMETEFAAE
jgi:TonB family protein